jgi:TrmH family RNA methyltransferase
MITSTSNQRVKWVRALQSKKSERSAEKAFVIEGPRLLKEALAADAKVRSLFHLEQLEPEDQALINAFVARGAGRETVSEHVLKAMSATDSPQRVLAVLEQPALAPNRDLDLALILDQISDPGNLGTILRTSRACGVGAVYMLEGTVDPFNPKVVRAAAGAHFRLPLIESRIGNLVELSGGLPIWVANPNQGVRYDCVDWKEPIALVIGSEAHGHRQGLESLAAGQVRIPLQEETESLNAAIASAVILFEIVRQRGEPCRSEP